MRNLPIYNLQYSSYIFKFGIADEAAAPNQKEKKTILMLYLLKKKRFVGEDD